MCKGLQLLLRMANIIAAHILLAKANHVVEAGHYREQNNNTGMGIQNVKTIKCVTKIYQMFLN